MTCRFSNTKNPNYLNIAEASDLHLGHARTPTEHIATNLLKAFPDNPETAELDLIILAGDIMDQLITLPTSTVVTEIEMWILSFLVLCAKYDIEVYIVEGTPRHDRKQSYLFDHLNTMYKIGAKVTYVQKLTVHRSERWGATFLFVPDEHAADQHQVYLDAAKAVRTAGLEKVDYGIMHSAFEYHYPPNLNLPSLDSALFMSLVLEWIFIGHIHVHRVYERIINAGSFDRLTFGEEEPKGHYRVKSYGNGTVGDEVKFIENVDAKRYDTIDVTGLDLKAVEAAIAAKNMPMSSNLRLLCDKTDQAFFAERELQNTFLSFRIVVKAKKEKKAEDSSLKQIDPLAPTRALVSVDITPENVSRLLSARMMAADIKPDDEKMSRLMGLVEGLVNG